MDVFFLPFNFLRYLVLAWFKVTEFQHSYFLPGARKILRNYSKLQFLCSVIIKDLEMEGKEFLEEYSQNKENKLLPEVA